MPVIDMLSYVNSELSSHRQQGEEKGQDQKYLPFFQKELQSAIEALKYTSLLRKEGETSCQ